MSDPEVIADRERYAEVGREYRELQAAHELAEQYARLRDDLEGARELLDEDGDDPELRKLVPEAPDQLERLAEEIRLAMVERDPNDDKNVLSRSAPAPAGTRLLCSPATCSRCSRATPSSGASAPRSCRSSPAEVGGFKEVTFAIKGEGAYSIFKYEGGTHRVQRVPKTESQGRIHTSTATVAVLPEAEDVEVEIEPDRPPDRRLPLVRARRAVGQHDRLGGAHHPHADRDRRLDAGREVPASEPREGDAGPACAPLRAEARRAAGGDRLGAALPGGVRRALGEDPHLQLPAGPGHRPPDQA